MIWDPEAETMAREQRARLQLSRLQAVVERVYSAVPFYRRRLDEAGVTPGSIRSLEDLKRLPFTSKADLRGLYPFGALAVPREQVMEFHSSSGTTGMPTAAMYTRADLELWGEVMARVLAAAGARPGDIIQNAYGYGMFTGGLGFHYGGIRLGAMVVPASSGNTARQIKLFQELSPSGLTCTPSYALHLAEAFEERHIDVASSGLRYGVFGAEPWTEGMRRQLEARLGIDAVDIYGLSEVIGPGVSVECCEAKNGLHINEDHFLPEVIDPASGEALPWGQRGELVLTTLTKEAMPLLRYRTGDLTALFEPETCRCGRTLVRMAKITGRTDDMLVVRGVNLFPSDVESALLRFTELEPHYQLVVDRERALDTVEVQVEAKASSVQDGLDRLAERVAQGIREVIGLSLKVTVLPPKSLPRSEGKALRVVDRRRLT